MQRLIQIIAPQDTAFTPMTFTRQPVVQRFWYGGLVAGLFGFALGFLLWMWQHGMLHITGDYFAGKFWHARLQIEGFLGSFLLGFALQSGPHVSGGKPPPSRNLLRLCHLLWVGLLLSGLPWVGLVGDLLVGGVYAGAGYYLLQITRFGNPGMRLPRGFPLAAGMSLMALTPWLPLDDPGVALFVLWCGPVTMALVAAQQLIQNVLGGLMLQGRPALHFIVALGVAWSVTALAAFVGWGSWTLAGLGWLATLGLFLRGTGFLQAARRFGWASINVTLSLGLFHALAAALWLALGGGVPDVAVHLLGAAFLTTLILGVTIRVTGFFSAGAVVPDRIASWMVALWAVVAWMRAFSPVWPMPESVTVWISLAGGIILGVWGVRIAWRLLKIREIVPVSLGGRKPENG
ncbi:MAG: NnrS family protein [Magnetococcales bacterium]|nr:NnrS family protein [Magnetococcales bacterium]